jgi:catechol 2,3-dioxygenase-like lactoylglutathione lyase family enzyme
MKPKPASVPYARANLGSTTLILSRRHSLRIVLHHVSLEIPPEAEEQSAGFWSALGFRRVPAPAEVAEYVTWFEAAGTQIHLIHTPRPTVPAIGHVAVATPDYAEAIARLRALGFEVDPARELWGEPRAVATAPGGHRVELMAAPPPSG